ncbi:EamA family transporter [Candidatus Micrarchaeota archaeon]|nr:EamA family transporter [Candidatus Micrarchaeota archaeon]
MENEVKGSLFIVAAVFLYSLIGVFSRFAGMNVFALVFYKVALAAFFFFFIFVFERRSIGRLKMDWSMTRFLIPSGFVVAITEVTFIGAYLNTTLANAAFINGLFPIFVIILSFLFLEERVDSRTLFSLVIGITGVGFIVGADFFVMLNEKNLFGDALALISALTYAAFMIYSRERAKMKLDIYYFVFWSYAIAALFVLPFNLAYGTFVIPLASVIWIAVLAFLCTNIAFILFCKGFEYIDASKGSIVALAEQLFVIINAFLFFGEGLSPLEFIGAALIISSVVLAEMKR